MMPDLIKLLLENHRAVMDGRRKTGTTTALETQAVLCCHQAWVTTPCIVSGTFNGHPSIIHAANNNIDRLLTAELSRLNLRDSQQYAALIAAILAWKPAPLSSLALQNCQTIRQTLWRLLPEIRKQQQLAAKCQRYQDYLTTDIVNRLRHEHRQLYASDGCDHSSDIPLLPFRSEGASVQCSQSNEIIQQLIADYPQVIPNGSRPLAIALQKYAAVNAMQQTLMTAQPVSTQLAQFRQAFHTHRAVLEKDRDSAAMKFLKGVATVLSLGAAALLGIWRVKGKAVTEDIQQHLDAQPSLPVLSACPSSI